MLQADMLDLVPGAGTTHHFKLIDGEFSEADATEVLLVLLNNKINFHNLQIFRIREQTGGDVSTHEDRVAQLEADRALLSQVLADMTGGGGRLKLEATVRVSPVE